MGIFTRTTSSSSCARLMHCLIALLILSEMKGMQSGTLFRSGFRLTVVGLVTRLQSLGGNVYPLLRAIASARFRDSINSSSPVQISATVLNMLRITARFIAFGWADLACSKMFWEVSLRYHLTCADELDKCI